MNVGNVIIALNDASTSPQLWSLLCDSAGFAAEILKALMDKELAMQNGQLHGPSLEATLAYVRSLPNWSEEEILRSEILKD